MSFPPCAGNVWGTKLSADRPIVVGVTGASGAPIALRVLQALSEAKRSVTLVVSDGAKAVLKEEAGLTPDALDGYATTVHSDHDLAAPIASGSRTTGGMAVVPCSNNTLSKIALGLSDTLITRAAQVHLKERRRLILVPRETPVPTNLLRHWLSLSEMGAVVLVAAPPYYTHPASVQEMVDYLAGKVLDHLDVPHRLYRGWKEPV